MKKNDRIGLKKTWLYASTCAAAALAFASNASAQDTAAPASATPAATADTGEVVVIGTRRTDRTLVNSASPVDVISSAELQAQPAANMLDSIKNIIPSFFVAQNTIADASSFVRSPSLRGLPGDEVLVMLNGKRFNRSALVQVYSGGDTGLSYGAQSSDLSAIPSIAIGNLQVLRDGATAQYGSDAIAGVLNFGLRKDAGFELQGRWGQYYPSDGDSRQIAGDVGVKLGERGFVNVAAEYDNDLGTSRGKTRPTAATLATLNPSLASQIPNYPGPAQIWGTSPSHGWKVLVNSGYEVTPNSEIYFIGNAARTHTDESFNYRPPITVAGLVTNTGSGTSTATNSRNGSYAPVYLTPCPAGNATCPSGGYVLDGNTFSAANLYPAGFTPRFVGVTKQLYGTAGYKGKLDNGLTWDLSSSLSRNTLSLSMYDSISPSYGPQTQTRFNFGDLIQKELDVNLDLTYPLQVGLASPITLSGGGEFRRETYKATAGDLQSYGAGPYASQALYSLVSPGVYVRNGSASQSPAASGYGGTSPQSAGQWSQRSFAFYGGAEADIIESLTVGLAGRYEHYSNFGSAEVGKANAIWKATPWLSIRGTVGTGFHAPSPGQSHDSILTTNFISGNQVQTGTYPVDNPISQYYGAKPLKPEKSTNWGAGVVLQPVSRATLTIDYYNIKVRNRIFISQPFSVTAADVLANSGLAAVGAGGNVSYFTNGLDTLTRGIDVVGSYRMPFAGGTLNWTLAYNYNKSTVSKSDPNVISTAQIIDVKRLAPNHRANVAATWSGSGFTINARENFYGSWINAVDYPTVKDAAGNTIAGQTFGSRFTSDLDVSYTFHEHFTLTLGGNNLFNTHPEKIAATTYNPIYALTGSTSDGQVYPRNGGPFGFNGGFYYVRVRVKY
ncbi:TonB-dependent receptor plug domain-containing protein [Sphingomonas nostoxanthinifaciens]|uniref:TonB-dependent receptor plug domain-containing protein n=1 Tax=Sphingomonas nostoxanthinifaciens TaxID=2872652 RepID=UPI001CC205D4|nr:TonB-dependent receptor [Sphingomonas nostoxanthinifaciens]UAK26247.1 TonB-dependent receptor [Sphingomonas nostoxanthinifaciens]